MSASPQKEGDGEPEVAQSPGDQEQQEQQKPQAEDEQQNPENMHDPGSLYETEVKEQDRWLPIANVARIMKTALPENAKIAKEAKECMQECVSEFISFITSEASEKCQHEKRKTVNGEDILFAMTSLGFENYSEALKIYLARFRDSNVSKSENQANRPASGHGSGTGPEGQSHGVASPDATGGMGGGLAHGAPTAGTATAAAGAGAANVGVAAGTGGVPVPGANPMTLQNGGGPPTFADGAQGLGGPGLSSGPGENGAFESYAVGSGADY